MNQTTVAIATSFLDAYAALPRQIQGKVTEFINRFQNNPRSAGIHYEKVRDGVDGKIHSVRIDDTYRGILLRVEESGVFLLLWVDHHDEAYEWARRKRCDINPVNGTIQVYDVQTQSVPDAGDVPVSAGDTGNTGDSGNAGKPLFACVSNEVLLRLGLPEVQLPILRGLWTVEDFHQQKAGFPVDAYENLEWIANGFSVEEVLATVEETLAHVQEEKTPVVHADDFASALRNPLSQRAFVIVEGEEELRRIMAEPLEKWRVFLHPAQRRIVQRNRSGPARVLGGAGTGKTVVAMHRAKWLAGRMNGRDKVLFTTYTINLAGDIRDNLRKICSLEEMRRIEVINLDSWVDQFLHEQEYKYTIVWDDSALREIWDTAISLSGEDTPLSAGFFMEEWLKVICAQSAFSLEQYVKASRIGRGTSLDRKTRIQVWRICEEYMQMLRESQRRDGEWAMIECRTILEKSAGLARYPAIVVDESQDLSVGAFRLLRSLAGPEHENDLFLVGDAHQRIYKNKATLSKCGINVRGRSQYLKINYRTTEETRRYAFSLLKGLSFDDLDDQYDDGRVCQSLTHGSLPIVSHFRTPSEEFAFILKEIKHLQTQGTLPQNICLVARTHRLLDEYAQMFSKEGIRTYEIKQNKIDDRGLDGIRIATLHRVKGLEFQYVFVAAVNAKIIPLENAMQDKDLTGEEEILTAERCLLYVALTRAQKAAYLTSYGRKSPFLKG